MAGARPEPLASLPDVGLAGRLEELARCIVTPEAVGRFRRPQQPQEEAWEDRKAPAPPSFADSISAS